MKRNPYPQPKYLWWVSGLVLSALLPVVLTWFTSTPGTGAKDVGNNPDHFFLWATNSTFSYRFIYDPLAADIWLCESGGFQRNAEFIQLTTTLK